MLPCTAEERGQLIRASVARSRTQPLLEPEADPWKADAHDFPVTCADVGGVAGRWGTLTSSLFFLATQGTALLFFPTMRLCILWGTQDQV